jgi:hypothetical protein
VADTFDLPFLTNNPGLQVYAADGAALGGVSEVYYDAASGRPQWLGLGWSGKLVPLEGMRLQDGNLVSRQTQDVIEAQPEIRPVEDGMAAEDAFLLARYFELEADHDRPLAVYRLTWEYGGE